MFSVRVVWELMNPRLISIRRCWKEKVNSSMAVGPGRVDRSDFFRIMSGLLKQDPRAKNITVIEEAFGLSSRNSRIDLSPLLVSSTVIWTSICLTLPFSAI